MSKLTIDDFVRREVIYCVSNLMWQLGKDPEKSANVLDDSSDSIRDLLSMPDYETMAYEAGWRRSDGQIIKHKEGTDNEWESVESWKEACELEDLDYSYSEAYEHWIVTEWLAEKLREKGEMAGDIAGLTIWGRTTTGQAISMDWVICEIFKELMGG